MKTIWHQFKYLWIFSALLTDLSWGEPDTHRDSLLTKSPSLMFTEIVSQALEHAPESLLADAREEQASSYRRFGSSWVSSNPKLLVNYIDDRNFDDAGQAEMEAGVEIQLRSIKARRDSQQLGHSYSQEADAWREYFQWHIAGQVKSVLADIQESETLFTQAQRAQQDAQQLFAVAEGLYGAGETSRDSVLQARSMLLEQDKNVLRAHANLVDNERAYVTLTGMNVRPATSLSERQSSIGEIYQNHPLLHFLSASVDLTRAQVSTVRQEAKGNSTLSIGVLHQRGDRFEAYSDSLSLGLSIPLGGGAHASTKKSDANRSRVDAEVKYQTAHRRLRQQLHEIEHELSIITKAIELNKEQAALTLQRSQMARRSFELGETTMTEVVRLFQDSHNADIEYQLMLQQQQRLISEFNQTVGVMP